MGEYDIHQMFYELSHYVRIILPYIWIIGLTLTRVMFLAESCLHLLGRQGSLSMPVLLNRTPLDYLL